MYIHFIDTTKNADGSLDYRIRANGLINNDPSAHAACVIASAAIPNLIDKSHGIIVTCARAIANDDGHRRYCLAIRKSEKFGEKVARADGIAAAGHNWMIAGTVIHTKTGAEIASIKDVLDYGYSNIHIQLRGQASVMSNTVQIELGNYKIVGMYISKDDCGNEYCQFILR